LTLTEELSTNEKIQNSAYRWYMIMMKRYEGNKLEEISDLGDRAIVETIEIFGKDLLQSWLRNKQRLPRRIAANKVTSRGEEEENSAFFWYYRMRNKYIDNKLDEIDNPRDRNIIAVTRRMQALQGFWQYKNENNAGQTASVETR